MKRGMVAVALGALIAFWAAPAFAQVVCRDSSASPPCFVEESTKTKGATTITWDSSYQDPGYTLGDTIIMTVTWSVDSGAATFFQPFGDIFAGFVEKRFTPRSKKDPAEGELTGVGPVDDSTNASTNPDGAVEVELKFTCLHFDKRRNVDIGNGHFKLFLNIDKDGDGQVDSVAGFGVNVHVEDTRPTFDTANCPEPVE